MQRAWRFSGRDLRVSRIKHHRQQNLALMSTLGMRQAGEALKGILKETSVGRVTANPTEDSPMLIGRFKKLG
jgi:hypothetical protein